jgi:hypothetical protein
MRRTLVLLTAAIAAPAPAAFAQIDDAVTAALGALDPALVPADGPATVQTGDFDGDGGMDVAMIVTDGRRRALAAFHGGPRGYQGHILHNRLPDGPVRIRVVPPGRYRSLGERGYVDVASDAIELVFPGRSSALYAWDGQRYRVHATESYSGET